MYSLVSLSYKGFLKYRVLVKGRLAVFLAQIVVLLVLKTLKKFMHIKYNNFHLIYIMYISL